MTALLDQSAEDLDLKWTEGDPVSLAFTVAGVDWSGDYTATIYAEDGTELDADLELVVSATFTTPDTAVTLTMSSADSGEIPAGTYAWAMKEDDGATRLAGAIYVVPVVHG